jgi:hypothetical protein
MLMISNADNHPIYIKWKEGGKRLAVGETERESVCVRDRESLKTEVASVVKTAIGKNGLFWDKLGSRRKDYLIATNYFNG